MISCSEEEEGEEKEIAFIVAIELHGFGLHQELDILFSSSLTQNGSEWEVMVCISFYEHVMKPTLC